MDESTLSRQVLSDKYVNRLIYIKTGLRYSEITEADREEQRRRTLAMRNKSASRANKQCTSS